jgi:hypothetical protein
MTDDIVTRLRNQANWLSVPAGAMRTAADEIERLRAALEDIANERGICLTCGKLAIRGPRGAVFCDPHLFGIDQGCRWSPQNPIDLARAALEGEKKDD